MPQPWPAALPRAWPREGQGGRALARAGAQHDPSAPAVFSPPDLAPATHRPPGPLRAAPHHQALTGPCGEAALWPRKTPPDRLLLLVSTATRTDCTRRQGPDSLPSSEASALAPDPVAARQQGAAHRQLRRPAGAGGRRPAVADRPPLARGGAVAGRRAAQQRRAEVLSRQPSGRHAPAGPRGDDQGPLGLRAGAPADEGRTRPRPLRGALLGRAAPPRPDGAGRLRLPAAPAATAEWPAGGKIGRASCRERVKISVVAVS